MNENVKNELLARMDDITIYIDEYMTFEELQYFLKGYEYCRDRMCDVIYDTCRLENEEQ